jgi:hypothetical protein
VSIASDILFLLAGSSQTGYFASIALRGRNTRSDSGLRQRIEMLHGGKPALHIGASKSGKPKGQQGEATPFHFLRTTGRFLYCTRFSTAR